MMAWPKRATSTVGRRCISGTAVPVRRFLLLVSLWLTIVFSCALSQDKGPARLFQGDWSFTFTSALTGTGTMQIQEGGRISVHLALGKYGRLFTNPVEMTVTSEGVISGTIYSWVLAVGKVEGSFSPAGELYARIATPFFTVGSVSGRLSEKSGSGTYESVAGNGTWSAWKN